MFILRGRTGAHQSSICDLHFTMQHIFYRLLFISSNKVADVDLLPSYYLYKAKIKYMSVSGHRPTLRFSANPKAFYLVFVMQVLFSSPEPKARVSYCHSAPSVVRP